MKKNCGKFVLGTLIGAGLGILFAPKDGKKTREELKEKINELLDKVKTIKVDEVSELIENKIKELKKDLESLDKEKVLKIAKEKASQVKEKSEEIVNLAIDKGTPILRKTAEEVREKSLSVAKDVVKRLEKSEKE